MDEPTENSVGLLYEPGVYGGPRLRQGLDVNGEFATGIGLALC
jgi:hypothetical protein